MPVAARDVCCSDAGLNDFSYIPSIAGEGDTFPAGIEVCHFFRQRLFPVSGQDDLPLYRHEDIVTILVATLSQFQLGYFQQVQ